LSDEALRQQTPRDERRIKAILGLAVGDALGATYEFCSPEDVA
jgi:ADP-ribosylglycohydrolase